MTLYHNIIIFQNMPAGTYVTMVHAEDKDHGVNGDVHYELVANPTNQRKDWENFVIDQRAGNITTAKMFDREEQEVFYVSCLIFLLILYTVIFASSNF